MDSIGRPKALAMMSGVIPSQIFCADVRNGGIERQPIAHEVCALSVDEEVEVGCPVGVREAMVFDRPSVIDYR